MDFAHGLVRELDPLWSRMLDHPFLVRTRDGQLDDGTFRTWLEQDDHFVRNVFPFVGSLIGKAPAEHYELLAPVPQALQEELRLFEEQAKALGADLAHARPGAVNEGYVHYLLAVGCRDPYPVAFTAYYAAERAYHESWRVVADGLEDDSPWWPLVRNWAGDEFGAFVDRLGAALDGLAEGAGPDQRKAMEATFERTVRWEIAFWEMALRGPRWPGLDPEPESGGSGARGGSA